MSRPRRLAATLVTALAGCLVLTSPASASPLRPAPGTGTFSGTLVAVSCTGTAECWAVGQASDGSLVADHWNGSAWAVTSVPAPQGAVFPTLAAVSCVSRADCWAVGQYQGAAAALAFAEHWNGARWSVAAMPSPAMAAHPAAADVVPHRLVHEVAGHPLEQQPVPADRSGRQVGVDVQAQLTRPDHGQLRRVLRGGGQVDQFRAGRRLLAGGQRESTVVPGGALAAAVAAALAVGAVAGVYPALRAARLSPAEALRSP